MDIAGFLWEYKPFYTTNLNYILIKSWYFVYILIEGIFLGTAKLNFRIFFEKKMKFQKNI